MSRINKILMFLSLSVALCYLFGIASTTIFASEYVESTNVEQIAGDQYNDSITSISINPTISNFISDIDIPVRISFDNTDVLSYSIETEGLTATEVTSGSMEYDIVATDEYGTFDIYATYADDIIVKSSVYTYQNGNKVYFSEHSRKHALEKYLESAIEDNIYTLQEAERIWSGFSCENEDLEGNIIDPEIETDGILFSDKGVICGTLLWQNDDPNEPAHPLQYVKVGIYKKMAGVNVRIATAYTNIWGYFSIEIPVNQDVFIGVFAGDDNVKVQSSVLDFIYKHIYEENLYDVSANSTTEVNLAPIDMSSDEGQALQISQAVLTARNYAKNMMGQMPDNVTLIYPSTGSGCYYNSSRNQIHITKQNAISPYPYSYASWDVIMHEYGHHIQHELNITNNIGSGHAINVNMADHYKDHHVNNNFTMCNIDCVLYEDYCNLQSIRLGENKCKNTGDALAWAESWATIFGMVAQNVYGAYLTNINTVNDTSYESYQGFSYNMELVALNCGESCELSIMAILWDIFDATNDSKDNISLGHQAFWNTTTVEGTYTFSDFMKIFYEEYPEYIYDIAPNLTKYEMSTSKPNASRTTSVNNTITISWFAQGGSTHYPNNKFSIIIYKNGTEIFRKNNIVATAYTLTSSEWEQLLSNAEYVCGETLDIQIAIAAYQDDGNSYITGPYYSDRENVSLQFNHNYEPYNSCYEKCSYCNNKNQISEHNYTHNHIYANTTYHRSYCECGASKLNNHIYEIHIEGQLKLDVCVDCRIERNHVHEYTYTPCGDGKTHHTFCGCGISQYEQCFGMVGDGNTGLVRCLKCNQKLIGNIILPLDEDGDENDVMIFKKDDLEEETE